MITTLRECARLGLLAVVVAAVSFTRSEAAQRVDRSDLLNISLPSAAVRFELGSPIQGFLAEYVRQGAGVVGRFCLNSEVLAWAPIEPAQVPAQFERLLSDVLQKISRLRFSVQEIPGGAKPNPLLRDFLLVGPAGAIVLHLEGASDGILMASCRALPRPSYEVPILLGVLAAICVFFARREYVRALASACWPKASGRIIASFEAGTTPSVEYGYRVAGQDFVGRSVMLSDRADYSPAELRARLERYPLDSSVTVSYDPLAPSRSTLEAGRASAINRWTIAALALAVAAAWSAAGLASGL
jgi:hypothetical protein